MPAEMEEEQPAEMEKEQPAEMEEEEQPAGQQLRLKEELGVPGCRRVLHVNFARPAMSGHDYEGPTWKTFSTLHVYLDGYKVASLKLPLWGDDVERWRRSFEFRMGSEWLWLCLCLEVVREDCGVDKHTRRVFVFRAEEPHTSGHTAVIGAAMVPLLDALVLGDEDDGGKDKDDGGKEEDDGGEKEDDGGEKEDDSGEEEDDGDEEDVEAAEKKKKKKKKKMTLEEKFNVAKGTRVFQERVKLQGWQQGDAGGEPTNVVCGTVIVLMYLREHDEDDPAW